MWNNLWSVSRYVMGPLSSRWRQSWNDQQCLAAPIWKYRSGFGDHRFTFFIDLRPNYTFYTNLTNIVHWVVAYRDVAHLVRFNLGKSWEKSAKSFDAGLIHVKKVSHVNLFVAVSDACNMISCETVRRPLCHWCESDWSLSNVSGIGLLMTATHFVNPFWFLRWKFHLSIKTKILKKNVTCQYFMSTFIIAMFGIFKRIVLVWNIFCGPFY